MAQNDFTAESAVWPVNELGEIVFAQSGLGSTNITGFVNSLQIPSDTRTGRVKAVFGLAATETATVGNDLTYYVKEGTSATFTSNSATGSITKYKSDGSIEFTTAVSNSTIVTYGNYSGTQKFVISCSSGSIDVSLKAASLGMTNLLSRPGNSMAFVGDSIVARAFGGSIASAALYSQPFGWVKWALEKSGQAFSMSLMAAVPSTGSTSYTSSVHPTTQEQVNTVLARADITDVFFATGINDLQADCPVAILTSAIEPMLDAIIASGKVLHLATILPMNSTYGNYNVSRQGGVLAYNNWIRSKVLKYGKRAILYDLYSVAAEPSSKTSSMKSNYSYDDLHPRNLGAYYIGSYVAAKWIAQGIPPIPLLSSAGDARVDEAGTSLFPLSANILQNGMFNLGTPSGGISQNWTKVDGGSASTVGSIVAAPNGAGSAQQLVTTFSTGGDYVTFTSTNMAARLPSLSSKIRATARVTVSSPTNFKNVRMYLSGFGNVNPNFTWGLPDPNDVALQEGFTGIMLCELDLAAWGVTALGGGLTLSFVISAAGAGSVTVQISEVSVVTV